MKEAISELIHTFFPIQTQLDSTIIEKMVVIFWFFNLRVLSCHNYEKLASMAYKLFSLCYSVVTTGTN